MDWLTSISDLPLWFLGALLVLILIGLTIALVTGRQVQLWPPSLGPSVDLQRRDEENMLLQSRLTAEQERTSSLQQELESANRKLTDAEAEIVRVREKLAMATKPLGSDQHIGSVLALFDRLALRVPAHEEDFAYMVASLDDLRVGLQRAGVSTIKNPLVRGLFEKMKADLIWVGETARGLVQLGITEHEAVVSGPMTSHTLEQLPEAPEETPEETSEETEEDVLFHRYIRSHSFRPGSFRPGDPIYPPISDFDKARRLVWTMIERSWRAPPVPGAEYTGVEYVSSKEVSLDQMALAMTTMYLFGTVDQIRANIGAEVDLLYDVYKQQEDE